MNIFLKILIWIVCAFLYCYEAAPIFFRLQNSAATDATALVGTMIMALGILLESVSDLTKNHYKKEHPHRFCDVGLFKIVRCPNYLEEVLIWIGAFVSGVTALHGVFQWVATIFGWSCIVYIMFGGARRRELRQNKNYGDDPEYPGICEENANPASADSALQCYKIQMAYGINKRCTGLFSAISLIFCLCTLAILQKSLYGLPSLLFSGNRCLSVALLLAIASEPGMISTFDTNLHTSLWK